MTTTWLRYTEAVMLWMFEWDGKWFTCLWCHKRLFRPASTLCAQDFTRAASRHLLECARNRHAESERETT